ncbi:MAG: Xaa-Pro peptidase family protein [Oscillospiraceae bacterium]
MKNPVERLSDLLIQGDSQKAVLVFSERNRRYFTEFPATDGALLVTADGAYLLMDFRYSEAAGYQAKNCKVVEFSSLNDSVKAILQEHHITSVYLETEALSYAQAARFEKLFQESGAVAVLNSQLDDAIRHLRMIKSPWEVKKIEASQAITDAAFQHILPQLQVGVKERDLALEIEMFMRKNGAESVAFDLIVVAGKNTSLCHGVPGDYAIQRGDFITMDTGAVLDGYYSDMTRTVALHHVSEEQRTIYDTVLKAHLTAMAAVKPGIPCNEIDKVARDIIETPYPGTFGHGLGHGVGFEIHEWPRFSKLDTTVLEPGMVITDEPGIYIPGKFGVRIEDMVVVTADACRTLTKSPKELIIL